MEREDAMCGGHACPLKEKCQHYLRYLESGGIGYWVVAMFKGVDILRSINGKDSWIIT